MQAALVKTHQMRNMFREQLEERRRFNEYRIASGRVEDLLMNGWTWVDFIEILTAKNQTVVWTGVDVFVRTFTRRLVDTPESFTEWVSIIVKDSDDQDVHVQVFSGPSSNAITPTLDVLFQLLVSDTTCKSIKVQQSHPTRDMRPLLVSPAVLEQFVGQAQTPRTINFDQLTFNEDACHALAAMSNGNVLLHLAVYSLHDGLASLATAIAANQGPTQLQLKNIYSMSDGTFLSFCSALRGNDTLKVLIMKNNITLSDVRQRLLFEALSENHGLETLDLNCLFINNGNWKLLWHSVARHRSIKSIDVTDTISWEVHWTKARNILHIHRDQQILQALATNTTLTQIVWTETEHNVAMMNNKILPLLDINLYRSRVRAIKEEPNDAFRWRLFGLALCQEDVRTNPAAMRLFLSENRDVIARYAPTKKDRLLKAWAVLEQRQSELCDERQALAQEMHDNGIAVPGTVKGKCKQSETDD